MQVETWRPDESTGDGSAQARVVLELPDGCVRVVVRGPQDVSGVLPDGTWAKAQFVSQERGVRVKG
jgi:hypothetical protein